MIDDTGIIVAFWVLAVTTVGCALMVAVVRELIHAVLFLALTFVGVAGIYIVLSADFVARGADADLRRRRRRADDVRRHAHARRRPRELGDRRSRCRRWSSPAWCSPCITFVVYDTSWNISDRGAFPATAASLGEAFLKPYVVPFEVASVLLMTAMIGAIVLTKEDEEEGEVPDLLLASRDARARARRRRRPLRDRPLPRALEAQRDRRADGRRADAERRQRHAARVLALRRVAAAARRPGVRASSSSPSPRPRPRSRSRWRSPSTGTARP